MSHSRQTKIILFCLNNYRKNYEYDEVRGANVEPRKLSRIMLSAPGGGPRRRAKTTACPSAKDS